MGYAWDFIYEYKHVYKYLPQVYCVELNTYSWQQAWETSEVNCAT